MTATLITDRTTTTWPPNLRRKEATDYLKAVYGIIVAPMTLAKWYCVRSDGPPAFKFGRTPLYPVRGLDEWATRRLGKLRHSTSDTQVDRTEQLESRQ